MSAFIHDDINENQNLKQLEQINEELIDELDLPEDLLKIAFEELGETKEIRKEKLIELRELISKLPNEEDKLDDTSDKNLIRFLRGRKYDVDKALETTLNLVRFNKEHPEWCDNLKAEESLAFSNFYQIPKGTDNGRIIVIFRPAIGLKALTPEYISENPNGLIRSMIWFMNTISNNVNAQVCGGILLESFEGIGFMDNFTLLKACPLEHQIATLTYIQNCIGFRFKGAFIFHEPQFVSWLWYVASSFLNEIIRNRLHLCGTNFNILKDHVSDVSILPKYYGGDNDDDEFNFVEEQYEIEQEKELNNEIMKAKILCDQVIFNDEKVK